LKIQELHCEIMNREERLKREFGLLDICVSEKIGDLMDQYVGQKHSGWRVQQCLANLRDLVPILKKNCGVLDDDAERVLLVVKDEMGRIFKECESL
jgi:hypothetical protein